MEDATEAVNDACLVCGKPNSNIHYNERTCNGCRVFFYRSSEDFLATCKYNNECVISYKLKRGTCFACRLRKCFETKMSPKRRRRRIVGKKKKKLDDEGIVAFISDYRQTMVRIYGEGTNNGFKAVHYLKQTFGSVSAFVDSLAGFDSGILAKGGPNASNCEHNPNMSIFDLFMYSRDLYQSTDVFDQVSTPSHMTNNAFKLVGTICCSYAANSELLGRGISVTFSFRQGHNRLNPAFFYISMVLQSTNAVDSSDLRYLR